MAYLDILLIQTNNNCRQGVIKPMSNKQKTFNTDKQF